MRLDDGVNYLWWEEYLVQIQGILDNINDIKTMTQYMHDIGELVWVNDHGSNQLIVLNPQWMADMMATIVSFKANWTGGILDHKMLPHIWKNYDPNVFDTLLSILNAFDIIYPITNDGPNERSLIPCMFDESPSQEYMESVLFLIELIYRPKLLIPLIQTA